MLGLNLSLALGSGLLGGISLPPSFPLPKANGGSGTLLENGSFTYDLSTTDVIGNPATTEWVFFNGPFHGSLTQVGNTGQFTYTPDVDYLGTDFFEYAIIDDRQTGSVANFDLEVEALPAVTRNFTKLSAAAGMYFTFPEVVFQPGIDIELMAVANTDAVRYSTFISGGIGNNNAFNIDVDGDTNRFYVYRGTSVQPILGRTYPNDDQLHQYRIYANSGPEGNTRYYSEIDGVVDAGVVWNLTTNVRVDVLGARLEGSRFYDSFLSDFIIKQDGVVVAHYKIDEDFNSTTVLTDYSGNGNHGEAHNVTGSELFTLNKNTTPPQWENGDQSVTIPIGYEDYEY